MEIVDNDQGGTYRVVYTVKFREAVCVLHVFHKKSKSGIATPKPDMDIIRERLKIAEKMGQPPIYPEARANVIFLNNPHARGGHNEG